jgi:hypothetical protein
MKAVIVGAGALGYGFLYPLLCDAGIEDVAFLDTDYRYKPVDVQVIADGGNVRGWTVATTVVPVGSAEGANALVNADLVFTATPPSAAWNVARALNVVQADTVIVCCENYRDPAGYVRTYSSTRALVCNGLANASAWWAERDAGAGKLGVRASEGELELSCDVGLDLPNVKVVRSYPNAYRCKMLLHNGPHAVVAYLGQIMQCRTIPETMKKVKHGSLWKVLERRYHHRLWYIDREKKRFANDLLPDPVQRVARCPSRKLMAGERLPQLYRVCQDTEAESIVTQAIQQAISYGQQHDPVVAMWLHQNGIGGFLRDYCGLDDVLESWGM